MWPWGRRATRIGVGDEPSFLRDRVDPRHWRPSKAVRHFPAAQTLVFGPTVIGSPFHDSKVMLLEGAITRVDFTLPCPDVALIESVHVRDAERIWSGCQWPWPWHDKNEAAWKATQVQIVVGTEGGAVKTWEDRSFAPFELDYARACQVQIRTTDKWPRQVQVFFLGYRAVPVEF